MGDLHVTDGDRAGPFGDIDHISDMVVMSMGDEDVIGRDLIGRSGGSRVIGKIGIDEEFIEAGFKAESGMTIPGESDHHFLLIIERIYVH